MIQSLPRFPMPILTPRLLIKPPEVKDGGMLNKAIVESIEQLRPFMPWAQPLPTIAESEEYVSKAVANWALKLNEEPYLPLFVFNRLNGGFIGSTGYHALDWNVPSLEIGYWLRTACSGQGYMTEAVNALTQYAFKQLKIKQVSIICDIKNINSKKIPERLNYELQVESGNQTRDKVIYARYNLVGLPELKVEWGA